MYKIIHDDAPDNPTEFFLGTIQTNPRASRKYGLPYQEGIKPSGVILPLFMLDHSGIALADHPFGCPWDSGQVGWMFCPLEKVREACGVKRVTKRVRERVASYLRGEIKMLANYMNGECYGYVLENGDSCWGYYSYEEAEEAAQNV